MARSHCKVRSHWRIPISHTYIGLRRGCSGDGQAMFRAGTSVGDVGRSERHSTCLMPRRAFPWSAAQTRPAHWIDWIDRQTRQLARGRPSQVWPDHSGSFAIPQPRDDRLIEFNGTLRCPMTGAPPSRIGAQALRDRCCATASMFTLDGEYRESFVEKRNSPRAASPTIA